MFRVQTKNTGIITAIISGILFYFSTGLHQCWPLLWLAPIPVLLYAYHHHYGSVVVISFFAFLLGKLNYLYYLGSGIPSFFILSSIIFNALIFSILVICNKWLVHKTRHWSAMFLFPALWTSYEFFVSLASSGNALMSLAYDQLHFLSLIQIVSITGIWGATFTLLTFSSGISYATYIKNRSYKVISLLFAILIPLASILYGHHRLHTPLQPLDSVSIGLVSINEPHLVYNKKALSLSKQYLPLIKAAAKSGAQFIVLPEKFIQVTENTYQKMMPLFQQAAKDNGVTLILGITRIGQKTFNKAIIIDPNGKIAGVYNKHYLLPGLENQFTPGKTFFNVQQQFKWGIAICKDMDFLPLGHHYGKTNTQLLFVPALDFNFDAWYHARSAIMRGIENGFAIARSAAHGYLSITDQMGRVIKLAPDFYQKNNVLIGKVTLYRLHTVYTAWGDWFAWLVFLLLLIAIARAFLCAKR